MSFSAQPQTGSLVYATALQTPVAPPHHLAINVLICGIERGVIRRGRFVTDPIELLAKTFLFPPLETPIPLSDRR